MANYHYLTGDKTNGPFNLVEMEVLLRTGSVNASTLVSSEGEESWEPLESHLELKAILRTAENQNQESREIAQTMRQILFWCCLLTTFAIAGCCWFWIHSETKNIETQSRLFEERSDTVTSIIKASNGIIEKAKSWTEIQQAMDNLSTARDDLKKMEAKSNDKDDKKNLSTQEERLWAEWDMAYRIAKERFP